MVFLLRNVPIPFPYVSYALGVTSVSVKNYIIGTLGVGISTFNYVLVGTQITSLTDDEPGPKGNQRSKTMFFIILGVEIICMILFTFIIVRIARNSLE